MQEIIPSFLLNRPELYPWHEPILHAFWELSATRPSGMGRGAIQFAEIVAYLQLHPQDDPQGFAGMIRRLDHAFLKWHADRDEKSKG